MIRRPAALLCLALCAGLLAGAAEKKPAAEPKPIERIQVRLESGGSITGNGPVERLNGVTTFRLTSGQLVSLPSATVAEVVVLDEPAAIRPQTAGPTSTESEVLVITNRDLPPPILTSDPLPEREAVTQPHVSPDLSAEDEESESDETPEPADDNEQPSALSYSGYRDHDGNGEAYWRDRLSTLRVEKVGLKRRIEELETELKLANARRLGARSYSDAAQKREEHYNAEVEFEEAEQRLKEVEAALKRLPDEARAAGALPGWLR